MAYTYEFPRPSVTATVVLINPERRELRMGIRSRTSEVFPLVPCCVGGFLNPRIQQNDFADNYGRGGENPVVKAGETVEQCAIRESEEEVSILLLESELVLFHLGSSDQHDPRAHVVNGCYYALISDARWDTMVAGDDIEDLLTLKIDEFKERPTKLAFNHTDLALKAIEAWEKEVNYQRLVKQEQMLIQLFRIEKRIKALEEAQDA